MSSSQSPSTGSQSGSPSTGSSSGSPSMSPEHMQKTAGQMAQGLAPSFENIVSVLTLITPLTFALYFIIESIFNQDIKAIIFISGLLLGTVIAWFPLVFILKKKAYPDESAYCKAINFFPWVAAYNVPSYSSYFISFTALYLIVPMLKNDTFNGWIFALMLIILGVDAIVKIKQKCTSALGIFLGLLVGSIWGGLWVCLFMYTFPELLYFNTLNNRNSMCSIPSRQSYKCQVFKNGKAVASADIPWLIPNSQLPAG